MADDTGGTAPSTPAAGSSPAPTATPTATAAPAAPATSAPATSTGGAPAPIPLDRHEAILAAARRERDDYKQRFEQTSSKYAQFETDPWGAIQPWLDQAAQHSLYGPQVTAYAARLLQAQRGQTPAERPAEPQPDVPIADANGHITGQTYSAAQLKKWQEWDWAQKQAALDARLQPFEQMQARQEESQQLQEVQVRAHQEAGQTLSALRQNPVFTQHEAKVKQALIDHPEFGANVHQAFTHVLLTEVLPGVTSTEQGRLLQSLQTQAAGGTITPSGSGASAPPRFKSFEEAARYYDAHPAERAAMANSR